MSAPDLVGTVPARAIEVAALLGDSVVEVKHCSDPRGGRIAAATWAYLAAALACGIASAAAFVAAVHVAAANQAALATWTQVAHRPAFAFRPHLLGAGYDVVSLGGLALAIAAGAIGLARLRAERVSPGFRIGTAPGVELAVADAPSACFPLVAPAGDGFVLHLAPGIDGELAAGDRVVPLAQLAAGGGARPSPEVAGALALRIPDGARIRASIGRTTLLVTAVERPRRHAAPLLAAFETRTLAYFAGSLAAHLGILALLQMMPGDGGAAAFDLGANEPVATGLTGTAHELAPAAGTAGDDGGGGGAEGPSGRAPSMALADPRVGTAARSAAGTPALSRDQALAEAREAGVLGVDLGGLTEVASSSDIGGSFDGMAVAGGIIGGGAAGEGGFGMTGNGFGGGGFGGGVAAGGYGTIGIGAGAGDGYRLGLGGLAGPSRQAAVPVVHIQRPEIIGDYDKTIIRRYIRRNIDKIRYCYEHELLARPGLHGAIVAEFFINPAGAVQRSTATGFDPEVARCVAGVIAGIEFPKPDGGGLQVKYPFEFQAP